MTYKRIGGKSIYFSHSVCNIAASPVQTSWPLHPSGGPRKAADPQSAASLPLPFPASGPMFFSALLSSFKSSEGLAPFVALDLSVFARPFQPTSFGRRLRNGRIRRSVIPVPGS